MTHDLNARPSEPKTCSICLGKYTGLGNNAAPVNNGLCCDACNAKVVIPARMRPLKSRSQS